MKEFFAYEIMEIIVADIQTGIDLIKIGDIPNEAALVEIKKAIEHGLVSEEDKQMLKTKGYFQNGK